jgi:hypothetical protein
VELVHGSIMPRASRCAHLRRAASRPIFDRRARSSAGLPWDRFVGRGGLGDASSQPTIAERAASALRCASRP